MKRFWDKVHKGDPDTCWEWQASMGDMYGKFWLNQKYEKAHRVSYILAHGDIPLGLVVRHKCDNPRCVNPNHLELGTQQDNAQDSMDRNRRFKPKGELNSSAVLSDADIRSIREDSRSTRRIAKDFGVSRTTISNIKQSKSWSHVT